MALTLTTGQTIASAADSATNWDVARIAGEGVAPTFGGLDNAVFVQGTGSVSAKIANKDTDAVVILDWYANTEGRKSSNTVVNLATAGNEVICGWVNLTTPSIIRSQANGGLYILVQSSTETGTTAPKKYSKWYIGGNDNYAGGWQFFMVDTRKTPSVTAGGGADLSSIRRIGFGIYNAATHAPSSIKADNLFVDAIWYKRPNYKVVGDGSTVCAWSNFLSDSNSNKNNLIVQQGSTYFLSCGIEIGDVSQTATTTFTDATAQKVEFKQYQYYYSTGLVEALNYSDYYTLKGSGAASFRTAITFGLVVGTGDNRQGVLGGSISTPDPANVPWKIDFQTDKSGLSVVKLYGMNLYGVYSGILLDNNLDSKETVIISTTFNNCGLIDPGTTGNGAEILNCNIIDPYGGTSANRGLTFHSSHNIKRINFITTGTPSTQHMTFLPDTPAYSVGFDAIIYYGDYSGSTIWHGEVNVNSSANIEIAKSNNANPDATEFEKTGGYTGTITATASFVLTLTNIVSGTDVTIVNSSTRSELHHEVSTGVDITYTHSGGETVDILLINLSYEPNLSSIYDLTLPNSNSSIKFQQIDDSNYVNP